MNISRLCLWAGCPGILWLLSASANAAQTGDSVHFTFTGRLVQQSFCTINNNQVINVPFGNVGISKVASGQYVQDVSYQLDCKGAASGATVSMLIKATPTAWDTLAAATDVTGLGVRFLQKSVPMALNTALVVNPDSPPLLQAKLVKAPDVTLTEQPFSATGTLLASYY